MTQYYAISPKLEKALQSALKSCQANTALEICHAICEAGYSIVPKEDNYDEGLS